MKQKIKINASSLRQSTCILQWHRTIIGGYKQQSQGDKLVYGVAFHAFINAMFKTEGRIDLARRDLLNAFRVPKYQQSPWNSKHYQDENHCLLSAMNYWEDYVVKDSTFHVLKINSTCYWCDGSGIIGEYENSIACGERGEKESTQPCSQCNGLGSKIQPATEVTFEILYWEDDDFEVWLCGTIDKIGKIQGGCYALGDYKTTSRKDVADYLNEYEMSAQLRFYTLSLKLMAEKYPESVLGQIGATHLGAFIEGIFIKTSIAENEYKRSPGFQFKDEDLDSFRLQLDLSIEKLIDRIRMNAWNQKEGIFNGSCQGKFSKCAFWHVCKAQSPELEEMLLARNFIQKTYDPLHHNS